MSEAFWKAARAQMMRDANSINLNAGTLSPTPVPVFEAVTELRRRQAENPSDFCWRQAQPLLARSRARLARYLNCRELDLLLLPNVTFAMNIAIESLRLPAGSEILTCDHEYGAMEYCLERYAKSRGLHVRRVPLPYRTEDPQEIIDAFIAGITPKTAAVFFSHCTTKTGLVLPARELTSTMRARRGEDVMILIDGAHAPGMIPLDIEAIGADFYGANCHKWIMAPAGSGFLHVADRHRADLQSIITSWGWQYDRTNPDAASIFCGTHWQADFEFNGTLDRCPQMVIADALDFREKLGGDDAITARYRTITDYARQKLESIDLKCVSPRNQALNGCILSFEFPCKNEIQVRDMFWNDHHIECPVTVAGDERFLRVSCAWFNTTEEIDQLADAARAVRQRIDAGS
jgi:isopenicillin-N epimerase